MQYVEFLKTVQEQARLDRDQAQRAVEATLQTLGERITRTEAQDLAAQLPAELRSPLQGQGEQQKYDLEAFLRTVAEREGCSETDARVHAEAVFQTLCRAVSHGEMQDVMSQLPKDFQQAFSCNVKTVH